MCACAYIFANISRLPISIFCCIYLILILGIMGNFELNTEHLQTLVALFQWVFKYFGQANNLALWAAELGWGLTSGFRKPGLFLVYVHWQDFQRKLDTFPGALLLHSTELQHSVSQAMLSPTPTLIPCNIGINQSIRRKKKAKINKKPHVNGSPYFWDPGPTSPSNC